MGRPVDPRAARIDPDRAVARILKEADRCCEPFGAFVAGGRLILMTCSSSRFADLTSGKRAACRTLIGVYSSGVRQSQVREDVEAWLASLTTPAQ